MDYNSDHDDASHGDPVHEEQIPPSDNEVETFDDQRNDGAAVEYAGIQMKLSVEHGPPSPRRLSVGQVSRETTEGVKVVKEIQFLLCFPVGSELYFLSTTPQIQFSFDEAFFNEHMNCTRFDVDSSIKGPVEGLLCLLHPRNYDAHVVICNTRTGQSLTLPRLYQWNQKTWVFFGYDPIDKNFKVLSMIRRDHWNGDDIDVSEEFHLLTLGSKPLTWRSIRCDQPHFHDPSLSDRDHGICINGSIYYVAKVYAKRNDPENIEYPVYQRDNAEYQIVRFDVRSEKFSFIKMYREREYYLKNDDMDILVNYNGHLGVLLSENNALTADTSFIELWVLDAEKHDWMKHIFVFPPLWANLVKELDDEISFVGVSSSDEIVLSQNHVGCAGFYLIYCNMVTNTIKKVKIQGLESLDKIDRVITKLGHMEKLENDSILLSESEDAGKEVQTFSVLSFFGK